MDIKSAKQLIRNAAEKEVPVPVLLIGAMGIGKSQIVKQVAEELGIGFIDLRLAQQEPGDLIGIPRATTRVNPKTKVEETVTVYARPEWFPDGKEQPRGILFLDELNRAPVDVRQAVFQLVKEKTMHTHVLPKGWYIVSAINPDNSNYQVETLDKAMLRRFCQIKVTHDSETWLAWAKGPGNVSDDITSFIAAYEKLLGSDEDFSVEAHPTPDQWTMLDQMKKANIIATRDEIEVFTGLVGKEAAIAYRKYIDAKFERPVTGREILDEYNNAKVKKKVAKQGNDEMSMTTRDLAAEMNANPKPTKQQIKNLGDFLMDVNNEAKASVVHKLPKGYLSELVSRTELTDIITQVQESVERED
jgi:hypothetical protein